MADLSTKDNPLHLRDERPDYVDAPAEYAETPDGEDRAEEEQPTVGGDPQDTGSSDIDKPTVSLDMDAVRKAEKEGKGYQ